MSNASINPADTLNSCGYHVRNRIEGSGEVRWLGRALLLLLGEVDAIEDMDPELQREMFGHLSKLMKCAVKYSPEIRLVPGFPKLCIECLDHTCESKAT